MAKGPHRLGSKQFFTMSVLAVSVLGLIVVTGAALKPTNTQSDASGGYSCSKNPELALDGKPIGGSTSVTYIVRVTNRDSHNKNVRDNCLPDTYKFKVDAPRGWKVTPLAQDRLGQITLSEGQSDGVFLTIERPKGEKKGEYYVNFGIYNLRHDDKTNDASINLKYTVE